MVSIDDAVLARYSREGHDFEIYVDPDKALSFRNGKNIGIREILAVEDIFKDASKGDRAGEGSLEEVFGTTDLMEVAKQILKKGKIQYTTEQRKEMVKKTRKAVVNIIARESYNPQTKAPNPPERIERAMEEAGVSVDPNKSAKEQVEDVISAIREYVPISIEQLKIEIIVPPAYTGKAYGKIREYNVQKEDWLNDGTLKAVVKIPAGVEKDLYDDIGEIAKGEAQFKRIEN
ncbi:MAG: ribosome assembly factor SBDS [Candidatus Undinarchaeales archaeon]